MASLEVSVGKKFIDQVRVAVQVSKGTPLSCPLPNMTLWNMHPKVYLALDNNDEAMCPYCSTRYIATDE